MKLPCGVVCLGFVLLLVGFSVANPISIGLNGGYSQFYMDNLLTRDIEKYGHGLDSGIDAAVKLIYDTENLPVNFISTIHYSYLHSKASFMDIACPHHSYFSEVTRENSAKIISAQIGIEYIMIEKKLSPYTSLNFAANYFDEVKYSQTPDCDWPSGLKDKLYSRKLRIGAGIGVGTYFKVAESIKLDFSINYNWLKLIGKKEYKFYEVPFSEKDLNNLTFSLGIIFTL